MHDHAEEDFDPLRAQFVAWFDTKTQLDAERIASRNPDPRWTIAVDALHADFVRWTMERHQVPPTRDELTYLLRELCLPFITIHGEQYAANVALREDLEAHEQFRGAQ